MLVLNISVTKRKMAVSSFLLKSLILLYLILRFKKTPGNKQPRNSYTESIEKPSFRLDCHFKHTDIFGCFFILSFTFNLYSLLYIKFIRILFSKLTFIICNISKGNGF